MTAFIASFMLVVLAEMGDKTQLLAMAFAAKYSVSKVLLGVFIATILNNTLAVAVGRFLTKIIPLDLISFIAAFSFIVFGLWTIREDKLGEEDKKVSRFGPVLTVGIAFFLLEMGDKTQLATVSLAVKYNNVLAVLAGSTLAMLAADIIGIVAGVIMHKHIPEKVLKWFSAVIFVLFGLVGIYKLLSGRISHLASAGWVGIIFIATLIAGFYLSGAGKGSQARLK